MNFENPAWRAKPVGTAIKVVKSLFLRRVPAYRCPVVPYDEGRSRITADLQTSLGLHLYRYGHRDPDLDLVRTLLRSGDIFIDGGAHIGLFSLVAGSRVGPEGRVIAFEPTADTRRILIANRDLNGMDWIEVRAEALSAGEGERDFVVFPPSASGLNSFKPVSAEGGRIETVRTISLDQAIPKELWPRIALIKLDLEGAEALALAGAKEILLEAGPDLLVEAEPQRLSQMGSSSKDLGELLQRQGYRFFRWEGDKDPVLRTVSVFSSLPGSPNLFLTRDPVRVAKTGAKFQSG